MADVLQKVRATIERTNMLPVQESVLVGLSGGADSVALLCVLRALGRHVYAAHVHHGLRGTEANRDEAFVVELCRQWQVPLFLHHSDVAAVAAATGEGWEEVGRRVRYTFFEKTAERQGIARIATAHTASDVVETVLWHMTRGCGIHGLSGIAPVRGNIVRPLLDCTRAEIEAYLKQRGQAFVTDSTNADLSYTRNRIRACVVPVLASLNPQLETAVGHLTTLARQEDAYLREQAVALLAQAKRSEGIYDRLVLASAPPALQFRVLALLGASSFAQAQEMTRLLTVDGMMTLPHHVHVKTERDRLQFQKKAPDYFEWEIKPGVSCEICGRIYALEALSLEEYENKKKIHKMVLNNAMKYANIKGNMIVRQRLPGDAYHPMGRQGGKTLKKLFNERHVPLCTRGCIPVLCDEQGIVLVDGFGCDVRVCPDHSTQEFLVFYEKGEMLT